MNRLERLQQLAQEHESTVSRMRQFASGVIDYPLNELAIPGEREYTINFFIGEMQKVPYLLHFRDKRLIDYSYVFLNQLATDLATNGAGGFGKWYKENWEEVDKESTRGRILDRNMEHFVEAWYDTGNESLEPDWNALQESHNIVMSGKGQVFNNLYGSLYQGFKTSALECFLDDTLPRESQLRPYLLEGV